MKKIILFLLSINFLWAFPPSEAYFSELLSDNGKVTKNTLKVKKIDGGNYSAYFDGEITLTGVLERTDNSDVDTIYSALRFYPDNNIDLPFLFSLVSADSYNIDDYKEFERLEFGVLLKNIKVKLPEPLNKRFLGAAAVRAEVTIRNYSIFCEGEAGREAYGDLVNIKLLDDVQIEYFSKDNSSDVYYHAGNSYYIKLEYNSKDDYVNIRDKANGKIIGKILKNDMINNGGILLAIDDYYGSGEKDWCEVYYMPPNAKDGKDAIYGFVHSSQIK
ncbi:hypothetical protein JQ824_07920 [Brachyspira hyodysenteriae]|uniref:Uncharacterized protein n=2 Tax=Brachyspira hyodysenteriae TaxID=159 RepID=A0A3B6W4R6_BRAHO|nr:hypothetical protein [Brachyspira hyodysenteriae]ANN63574.1 hypothetical protein BHYOB78_06740 [Brachyspira hyodysenteriae ATCC 27164]KLI22209.1 hypothetical protein SU43_09315 [Brachyspira hyodysenteriae]KLI27854.1 hypothetical protein SZ47_03520 [Brachyspira hyodysenteriae]MBT8720218.1 hypothetical protein [Brachyspira hyodysenteriae]MBT8730456.1 hypothetical protein [Brachyspira hyodysenteriae]